MDKLFDSVNGMSISPIQGKDLRCAARDNLLHVPFWYEAIGVLNTIHFIKPNGTRFIPPSVRNWIVTLKGFIHITK